MTKIRLWLFVEILVFTHYANAQEGFSSWEKNYFRHYCTLEQKNFINKVEFPSGILFPKIEPVKFCINEQQSWNLFLKKCFAAFFTESKSYAFNKTASLVYGLFNLGNYDTYRIQPILKSNMNDTAWAESVFSSLTPVLKESWILLDAETRNIYSDIICHTENYLKTFNFKKEHAYFVQLQKYSRVDNFIKYNYGSKQANEYRKAEAFVYRRIFDKSRGKGNWTEKWMIKMIKDLKQKLQIK
jgi:hypothetical protein